MSLSLRSPSVAFIESDRNYLREFEEAGDELYPFTTGYPNDDVRAFLARLASESEGKGLPKGYVAHSTYWLVRDDRAVVGVSNLRHEMTPHLRLHPAGF